MPSIRLKYTLTPAAKAEHDAKIKRRANRRINKALSKLKLAKLTRVFNDVKYQVLFAVHRWDQAAYFRWLRDHPEDIKLIVEKASATEQDETSGDWRGFSLDRSSSKTEETEDVVAVDPEDEVAWSGDVVLPK